MASAFTFLCPLSLLLLKQWPHSITQQVYLHFRGSNGFYATSLCLLGLFDLLVGRVISGLQGSGNEAEEDEKVRYEEDCTGIGVGRENVPNDFDGKE